MEVGPAALRLSWPAPWAGRHLGPERVPDPQPFVRHKRHWILLRPLGVTGVITPWNHPFSIPIGQAAMALAAGNGVALKPSEITPLLGKEIVRALQEAGLPRGPLGAVRGGREVGAAPCGAAAVRKVFFTGSIAAGRDVLERPARRGKTVQLGLGGNDPPIACADADVGRAVAGTLWAAASNSGPTCAAVEREALRPANDTESGLAASVWPRDRARGRMLAEHLEAGMAIDRAYSDGLPQLPWGGTKASGVCVARSKHGLYEMAEKRLVAEDSGRLPVGRWYPYDEARRRGFAAVLESVAHSRLGGRAGALWRRRRDLARYVRGLLL